MNELSPAQLRIARVLFGLPEADGYALAGGAAVLSRTLRRCGRERTYVGRCPSAERSVASLIPVLSPFTTTVIPVNSSVLLRRGCGWWTAWNRSVRNLRDRLCWVPDRGEEGSEGLVGSCRVAGGVKIHEQPTDHG
jgi:hypothetical protein